jgi:peroxiredoxin
MMRNFLLTIGLIAIIFGCSLKNENKDIIGSTSGYTDSTMLVLHDVENQIAIDTAYIVNNRFRFSVKISEPTQFAIMTGMGNKSEFEYMFFWVDKDNITIKAAKGNLRFANTKGSALQKQSEKLLKSKKLIYSKRDSLISEFMRTERKDSTRYDSLLVVQSEINIAETKSDTLFIRDNPNSLISAHLLTFVMKQIPKYATKSLFEDLTLEMKESKYGQTINQFLNLSKDFKIGDSAEDFHLPDLKGNKIGLCNYKGKYLLLEFWGSGCGPCRMENPNLRANYKEFKDKGFEILGITLDKNIDEWEKAVQKDSIIWTTLGDLKGMEGDVIITYNIKYIPKNYLIDPSGIIIAEDLRGHKLGEKLKEIFEK